MRLAAFALLLICLTVVPGHAEKRVALVIGNSNYHNVGRLGNPANDAEALAALLKASGFYVVKRRSDVGIAEMRWTIGIFPTLLPMRTSPLFIMRGMESR
jgi:hypothetical protein